MIIVIFSTILACWYFKNQRKEIKDLKKKQGLSFSNIPQKNAVLGNQSPVEVGDAADNNDAQPGGDDQSKEHEEGKQVELILFICLLFFCSYFLSTLFLFSLFCINFCVIFGRHVQSSVCVCMFDLLGVLLVFNTSAPKTYHVCSLTFYIFFVCFAWF